MFDDQITTGVFTDFTGTITDEWFGNEPESTDPSMLWIYFKLATDDIDRPEHIVQYRCGKGWVTEDAGETAVLYTNSDPPKLAPKQQFNLRWAEYARFIQKVGEILPANLRAEFEKKDARQAKVWHGLTFYWQAVDEGYRDKTSQQWKPFWKVYPGSYVGEKGEAGVGGAANGKVDQASVELVASLDPSLRAQLQDMAQKSASYDGYTDRVLVDLPEVRADGDLRAKVTGKGVWEALRASG